MIHAPHPALPEMVPNSFSKGLAGGAVPFKAGLFDPSDGDPFGPAYDSVGLECSCELQAVEIAKRWAATDAERRDGAWLLVLHNERLVASFPPGSYR